MEVELIVPARVRPGEPVPITLHVLNTGPDAVVLGLTGRPVAFDLVVARPDGTEVWRRLHGATVPLVLELRRVAPGERLVFTDRWLQVDNAGRTVLPGSYTVRGHVPAEDLELDSEPRDLVISR
jgi:hypothetical protein